MLPEYMNTQEYQRWLDLETHLKRVEIRNYDLMGLAHTRLDRELGEIFHEESLEG